MRQEFHYQQCASDGLSLSKGKWNSVLVRDPSVTWHKQLTSACRTICTMKPRATPWLLQAVSALLPTSILLRERLTNGKTSASGVLLTEWWIYTRKTVSTYWEPRCLKVIRIDRFTKSIAWYCSAIFKIIVVEKRHFFLVAIVNRQGYIKTREGLWNDGLKILCHLPV